MRITIEKVDNGFLVVYETERGRIVRVFLTAGEAVAYVKEKVDPSPIQVATDRPLALA